MSRFINMDDCCELPFVSPSKSGKSKSLKDIAEEIKDGTTGDYKELSDLYKAVMGALNKDEKVS